MKKFAKFLLITLSFLASAGIGPVAVQSEDPTPTVTPTATARPKGPLCSATQACVDQQVPQIVQSCLAADTACTLEGSGRFAMTAEDLANRAIDAENCNKARFLTSKRKCNLCYQTAKKPLSTRAAGVLFRGLIGQAVRVIEAKRVEICSALTK